MRVIGHISAGRDLVRYHNNKEILNGQKRAKISYPFSKYTQKQTGFSAEIHDILRKGFVRDAQWIGAISEQNINFPTIATGSFSKLRETYYRLALTYEQDPSKDLSKEAKALQEQLAIHLKKREDLDLLNFDNFVDDKTKSPPFSSIYRCTRSSISSRTVGLLGSNRNSTTSHSLGMGSRIFGWNVMEGTYKRSQSEHKNSNNTSKRYFCIFTYSLAFSIGRTSGSLIKTNFIRRRIWGLPTGDSLIDIAGHPGPKGLIFGKTRFKRSQTQRLAY